jgi:hypothetical protein
MPAHIFRVARGGQTRTIYSDASKSLLTGGDLSIKRASHVEPGDASKGQNPLKWYADMSPVNGPVLEGKDTRDEALKEEVSWLLKHNLPTPE